MSPPRGRSPRGRSPRGRSPIAPADLSRADGTQGVRTPSLDTPARNLSGGNIQKLIMARELSRSPGVLLLAQPTRGIDVASAQYIHERLFRQRAAGTAVVVISEDLDEVMTICDRVLVMYEGRIVGEVDPRTTSREAIGLLMAGTVSGRS